MIITSIRLNFKEKNIWSFVREWTFTVSKHKAYKYKQKVCKLLKNNSKRIFELVFKSDIMFLVVISCVFLACFLHVCISWLPWMYRLWGINCVLRELSLPIKYKWPLGHIVAYKENQEGWHKLCFWAWEKNIGDDKRHVF